MKKFAAPMIDFFKGLYKKLIVAIKGEQHRAEYAELINIFRSATPLEISDITKIQMILQRVVPNKETLNRKFNLIKEAMRFKQSTGKSGPARNSLRSRYDMFITNEFNKLGRKKINKDKDVSYYINGRIIYGDVDSSEEKYYFSKDNVEVLNSAPLKRKRCDLDCVVNECQGCIEARFRKEMHRKLVLEHEREHNARAKRRRTTGGQAVVGELNEQLGCPLIVGRALADDKFSIGDLDSEEREEFIRWRDNNKKMAAQMNRSRLLESSVYNMSGQEPAASNMDKNANDTAFTPFGNEKKPVDAIDFGAGLASQGSPFANHKTEEKALGNPFLGTAGDGKAENTLANPFLKSMMESEKGKNALANPFIRNMVDDEKEGSALANPFIKNMAESAPVNPFAKKAADEGKEATPAIANPWKIGSENIIKSFHNPFAAAGTTKRADDAGEAGGSVGNESVANPFAKSEAPTTPFGGIANIAASNKANAKASGFANEPSPFAATGKSAIKPFHNPFAAANTTNNAGEAGGSVDSGSMANPFAKSEAPATPFGGIANITASNKANAKASGFGNEPSPFAVESQSVKATDKSGSEAVELIEQAAPSFNFGAVAQTNKSTATPVSKPFAEDMVAKQAVPVFNNPFKKEAGDRNAILNSSNNLEEAMVGKRKSADAQPTGASPFSFAGSFDLQQTAAARSSPSTAPFGANGQAGSVGIQVGNPFAAPLLQNKPGNIFGPAIGSINPPATGGPAFSPFSQQIGVPAASAGPNASQLIGVMPVAPQPFSLGQKNFSQTNIFQNSSKDAAKDLEADVFAANDDDGDGKSKRARRRR